MIRTPELTDGIITLNGYELSDIDAHLAGDDIENQKWLNDFHKSTKETVERAIRNWQKDWVEETKRRTFAVRDNSGNLVGGCEVRLKGKNIADFSYWIFPKYRGKGYAKRALNLIVDYSFANLEVKRAQTYIDVDNVSSIKTAEAAGFKDKTILKGHGSMAGKKRDVAFLVRSAGRREEVRNKLNELMFGEYDFQAIYDFAKGLMDDGPTAEEIKGFVDSIKDRAGKLNPNLRAESRTIDISGSGGDAIKTINVGSIASLILAAGGLVVGKGSTRAYTGTTGSKDLYDALGMPIDLVKEDIKEKERLLEKASFAAYYYPALSPNYGTNNGKFMGELKEKGLAFITPWHVAAWLYNPLKLNFRIYGMFTDKYFDVAADVLKDQGVEKGWIINGVDGLDEISNVGSTKILEFSKDETKRFELSPEDFEVKKSKAEDIKVLSKEEAIEIAKEVISGKRKDAFRDLVAINAAAGFYIAGIKPDLKSATDYAVELLESGKVEEKVEEVRSFIGSIK